MFCYLISSIGDKIEKNNIEVIEAGIAPEILDGYLRDIGLEQNDHCFIRKVGRHIEIGGVKFQCVE